MSEATGGPETVAAPSGGWCGPGTGTCRTVDTDGEAATAEAGNDHAAGDVPTFRGDGRHRRVSPPTC